MGNLNNIKQEFSDFFDLVPEEELTEARDYLCGLTARWIRAVALLMVVSVVALWPSDLIIFGDNPLYRHTLSIWRAVLSSTSLVLAIGLTYWGPVRRHPCSAFSVAAAVVMGTSGFAVGELGGIDNPFFYAVYPIPAITMALLGRLRERIIANLSIVIAYLAGFIYALGHAPLPAGFAGPVIFLLATSTGMIFLGHIVYRLVGTNHARRNRLARLVTSQQRDLALATREALTAHDKVRERILRDLHDNVGPIITALHLDTFAARQRMQRSHPPAAVAHEFLETVETHATSLKRLIRSTLLDLDPYGIERGLLTDVIGNTLIELGIPASHQLAWKLDRAINDLPTDIKQALHLIVRECAHNTVKHAKATRIEIEAGILDGVVHFRYRDNGIGCDLAKTDESIQFGLAGIRLRAIHAGGSLEIKSQPSEGFSVTCRIPLGIRGAGAPV